MKTLIYVLCITIAMFITSSTFGDESDSSKVFVMQCPGGIKKEIMMNTDNLDDPTVFMFNDDNFSSYARRHNLKSNKNNLVDLNDPNIISFEKEITKNGNEKITIIRKK